MKNTKPKNQQPGIFKVSEAFSSLQSQIHDQQLFIELKEIEGNYNYLFRKKNNEDVNKDPSITVKTFSRQWKKFYEKCLSSFYNQSLEEFYSDIKSCISKIQEIFLKLSSRNVFPHDREDFDEVDEEEVSYEQTIMIFNEDFLRVKQVFNLRQYSQFFINSFQQFLKRVPTYIKTFYKANMEQNELLRILSTLRKKTGQLEKYIQCIEQTKLPIELSQLNEVIQQKVYDANLMQNEEEDFQPNSKSDLRKSGFVKRNAVSPPRRQSEKLSNSLQQRYKNCFDDDDKTEKPRKTSIDELLSEIASCSNRLRSISGNIDTKLEEESDNVNSKNKSTYQFLQRLKRKIESELNFLDGIQKVEIRPYNNSNSPALESEKERIKVVFDILNKSQSALTEDVDTDKLKRLKQNELISIILSLCKMIKDKNGDSKLQIPLELTFCQGTPEEFRRLSRQYFDTAKYNEWAELEIRRLNSENVRLTSENEIINSQASSKDNEYKLMNELRMIDERVQIINSTLEQKLQYDSKSNRSANSLETSELNNEVEELIKRKRKIKRNLKGVVPGEMLNEIESLNNSNAKLQALVKSCMDEIDELRKQMIECSKECVRSKRSANESFNNGNENDDYERDSYQPNRQPNQRNFGQGGGQQFSPDFNITANNRNVSPNSSYSNRSKAASNRNLSPNNRNVSPVNRNVSPNSSYSNRAKTASSRNLSPSNGNANWPPSNFDEDGNKNFDENDQSGGRSPNISKKRLANSGPAQREFSPTSSTNRKRQQYNDGFDHGNGFFANDKENFDQDLVQRARRAQDGGSFGRRRPNDDDDEDSQSSKRFNFNIDNRNDDRSPNLKKMPQRRVAKQPYQRNRDDQEEEEEIDIDMTYFDQNDGRRRSDNFNRNRSNGYNNMNDDEIERKNSPRMRK